MTRQISQRELRNQSGEILRAVEAGEDFVVTVNGRPVAEVRPYGKPRFVSRERLIEAFRHAPHIDYEQFRRDIDAVVDQSIEPRA